MELAVSIHGINLVHDGITALVHASRAQKMVQLIVTDLEPFGVIGAQVSGVFSLQ